MLKSWTILVLLASLLIIGSIPTHKKDNVMADLPAHIGSFLWLAATNESLQGAQEKPEVYDIPAYKIYYNGNTNRIVILGDDDGRKEIPTFAADFANPANQGILMLSGNGDLAGYTDTANLNPLIEAGTFAVPERWPVGDARVGDIHMTTGLVNSTAVDGVTMLDRAVQSNVLAPVAITSLTASVTYNYSIRVDSSLITKQTLFSLDTNQNFVVTDVIVYYDDAATSTAFCSFGWNANANDVVADTRYSNIDAAGKYVKATIINGAMMGTSTQTFGVKFNTTDTLHYRIDVIGILRYVP